MDKKPGDMVKIKARGEVKDVNDEGRFDIILHDVKEATEDELARIEEKDGILDDSELAFVFGEDI